MSILKLNFNLFKKILLICFFTRCFGDEVKNLPAITKGFGPYYISTRSVDKCKTTSTLDKENVIILNVKVNKTSRVDEEYIGNATVPNDIQIIKGTAEILKWQDGGFRIELKKFIDDPCNAVAYSLIVKMTFKPDKYCNIKKGTYSISSGLNPNRVFHMLFNTYHYERYLFKLEWFTKKGSLGCFQTMCEVKPLRASKRKSIRS